MRFIFSCFLLLISCFFTPPVYSSDNSVFSQANAKYQAGDFKGAAQGYRQIVDSKEASSSVYYNLGNAMLRLGNKGQALINYKRALEITPRDKDAQWNVHVLKGALPDRIEDSHSNILKEWLEKALDFMTTDEMALILSFSIAVLLLVALANLFLPAASSWAGAIQSLAIFCLIVSAVFLNLKWNQRSQMDVVVLDKEVIARNGPAVEESKAFLLHEGAEGRVIDESKDWYYISLANKNAGWIPKESCEAV